MPENGDKAAKKIDRVTIECDRETLALAVDNRCEGGDLELCLSLLDRARREIEFRWNMARGAHHQEQLMKQAQFERILTTTRGKRQ